MEFKDIDIGTIERILFPLIKQLTGFDISGAAVSGGVRLSLAADLLGEVQELLRASAAALADGFLDWSELEVIIRGSQDIPEALARLTGPLPSASE